jgi:hypothetical protein
MNMAVPGDLNLNSSISLDNFLEGVQSRAFRIAQIATGDQEDALDLVQAERSKLREQFEQKLRPDNNRPNQDDAARGTQNQQRIRNAIRQNQGALRHNRHQTPQVRPQTQQRPSATSPVPPAPR